MPRSAPEAPAAPAVQAPAAPNLRVAAADRADAPPGAGAPPLGWLLLLGGLLGLGAAFVLTVEKFALLTDPGYVPSCSINPVLSCGSVMRTPQAEVFGFPNPLLGVVGFSVVAATGAALLAGAWLRRWYWLGLQAGVTVGAAFVHWLIFQSLYRIGALCPYCMVVWAVTIPLFWYVTLHNLNQWHLPLPARARPAAAALIAALTRFHTVALTLWFVGLLALITSQFWAYWSLLLPGG